MTTTPARPLVVLCVGTDCGTRHEEHDGAGLRGLRDVVRKTPGAVLVTTGCLRGCTAAHDTGRPADHAVGVVAWRAGESLDAHDPLVLAGVEDPDVAGQVAAWVRDHADGPPRTALESLPLGLRRRLIS